MNDSELNKKRSIAESEISSKGALPVLVDQRTDQISGVQNLVFSCPVDHSGASVYVKGWVKPHTEYSPIVIVHGLGENISYYREFAKMLTDRGFSVFAFDLRGHGRSGHMLGHVPNFDSLISDLLQVVSWIRFKSKRKSPFIIAQGLGVLITIYFNVAYANLCKGIIMTSPCVSEKIRLSMRLLIWTLAEISPTLRLPRSCTPKCLSPNPLARSKSSPKNHRHNQHYRITANFASEITVALSQLEEKFKLYHCPSLIFCPLKDAVHDYSKLYEMIGRHSYKELFQVKELESSEHHLLRKESPELSSIVEHVVEWLRYMDTTADNEPQDVNCKNKGL